jgi:hypothetical protein
MITAARNPAWAACSICLGRATGSNLVFLVLKEVGSILLVIGSSPRLARAI